MRRPDLISVIIPARDRAHVIGFQLEALADQRTERAFEVIVADNGSTDDTVAVARSFADRFARLEVVEASARRGRRPRPQHGLSRGARRPAGLLRQRRRRPRRLARDHRCGAWEPGSIVAGRIYPMRLAPDAPRCDDLTPPTPRRVRPRASCPSPTAPTWPSAGRTWSGSADGTSRSGSPRTSSCRGGPRWRACAFVDAPDAVMFKRGAPKGWIRFRQYHRWGRAATRLYRRYHDEGMLRRPARTVVRRLGRARLPRPAGHGRPATSADLAVRQAGWYTGYLAGSVRYRVLVLLSAQAP